MLAMLQANPALLIALTFGLGLRVGSFLNGVLLRFPVRLEWSGRQEAREGLALPEVYEPKPPGLVLSRSACPHGGHALSAWENIPLLSFLLLRGKCTACKTPISWQYPAVELITGILFALCVWRFGISLQLLFALPFTAALVVLSGIDLRTTLLPDQITLPLLWLGLIASLMVASPPWRRFDPLPVLHAGGSRAVPQPEEGTEAQWLETDISGALAGLAEDLLDHRR